MIWIVDQDGKIIREDGLGFLEGDSVLSSILLCLFQVPLEPQLDYKYSVPTL